MRIDYGERAPRAELARSVVCLWTGFSASGAPGRVLPDGCADIIWAPGRAPFGAGPDTHAKLESLPGGPRAGIRFRPGAAAALLGLPAREIRDLRVPLAEIWRRATAARLAESLERAASPAGWLAALETAVLEHAHMRGPADPAVADAVALIERRIEGGARARSQRAGALGERQLRRRFVDAVGYGPKTFERVLRFQRFLRLARQPGARAGIAELALAAGYADQPHLTRECVRLAGLPPAALLSS